MITRRRLVVAAMLALASFAASINLLFASLVRMGDAFAMRPEILASISSIYFASFFISSIAGGQIGDRFGVRPVLLAGCAFTSAGGAVVAARGELWSVVVGAVAMGLGGGIIEPSCSALLHRLFPGRARAALSLSQAGYCLGAVGGPLVMGLLLPQGLKWQLFFWPVAAVAAVNLFLFASSTFHPRPVRTAGADPTWTLAQRRSVLLPSLVILLYVFAETTVVGFLNIYLFEFRAAPESIAIQSIAMFWAAMLVGRLLAGRLPDRLGDKTLIAATMLGSAAAVAASALTARWSGALACFLAASLFMAATWPTIVSLAASLSPDHSNAAIGITVAAGSLGCVLSPPIMGRLLSSMTPETAMALVALPLVMGAVLILRGSPHTKP